MIDSTESDIAREMIEDWIGMFDPQSHIDFQQGEMLRGLITQTLEKLTVERDAAAQDMRERCAGILIAEHDRILSKQEPTKDPMSFADTVNANLRMMAVILPKLADDIRALPTTVMATEGEGK